MQPSHFPTIPAFSSHLAAQTHPTSPSNPPPQIYDRDGREKGEFVRGDMYIRDMKNTKGHVSGLTCGCWHPTDRFTAMTSSEDGTVRCD